MVRLKYSNGPFGVGEEASVSWTRPTTAQRAEVGGGRRGVAVLGLEVGDHLGVVTSAEPEPRVDALVVAVAQHVTARGRDRGGRRGRRGGSAGRSLFCHGRILADRCDIEGHVPVPR